MFVLKLFKFIYIIDEFFWNTIDGDDDDDDDDDNTNLLILFFL